MSGRGRFTFAKQQDIIESESQAVRNYRIAFVAQKKRTFAFFFTFTLFLLSEVNVVSFGPHNKTPLLFFNLFFLTTLPF